MMSLWDALRMNMMISYQELVRTFPNSSSQLVKDGFYIENEKITNIIGIAGQGKSTILRKIFVEQLFNGNKIPFFIELRKVSDEGIRKSLQNILVNLSLKPSDIEVEELLASNKIILMLDGFDEINSERKNTILHEIVRLNLTYNLQIITTTRPGTAICSEPSIVNFKVQLLVEDDILSIIEKLNSNNDSIDIEQLPKIKETIRNNKNLVSVMTSPILVTLFHVCYPYMDIIPNNTVEFYSNLFMTLYLRHDKVKNFDREKSSSLSHNDAYDCFCALCFYSIFKNSYDFTEQTLIEFTKASMQLKGKHDNCGPENLAVDFVDVTCLIQREGYNKYIFIHKSIQEYHAAEFIRNISSDKKPKFYNLIMEDIKQNNYRYHNTISFLQETDEIDCKKNLVIPLCEHYKIHKWNDMEIVDYKDLFREFFVDSTAQVVINNGNYSVQALNYSTTFMSWIAFFENEMYYDLYNIVTNILFSHENSRSLPEEIFTVTKDGISQISLILLINRMDLFDIALDAFIKQVREIYQHLYVNSSVTIKNETESINEFFDL
ncbi:NACHT domain-containing protein [Klebsiella pneumoniae]|uniref:NACHT domain-containing protein n=2 Tax=Klebsiella pneumoniae TaxID=573 RepID=UPI000BD6E560|nr:NACHT domain-containing protein [Klebsiella pneumoniae]MDM8685615.1 NACHT domain-containing protein [Klebsiella pneumoniae]MDM8700711.1 NACHT domain-containing protein [Klebsiella pneumoniae]MDM9236145.1 NACHT domain-containing protein [Klebsiella pneumoniae]PCR22972.1 NACHT domain protein [Klebsiella pneumoniae]SXO37918.1 Predicted NTPase (NACHT family) [Klebsiella pneumoniae]